MNEHRKDFERDGIVVVKGFYDVEREIEPIREGVRHIVELVARKHGIVVPCGTPNEAMNEGYQNCQ